MLGKNEKNGIRKRFWLKALSSFLLMLLVFSGFEFLMLEKRIQQDRNEVSRQLSELRSNLEYVINNNLSLTRGLSAFISLHPDLDQATFATFSEQLMASEHQIRSFGAAKDLVVSHVYPMAGNERALGLNYRASATQRDAALLAMELNKIVMAGPLELVQGGVALIARKPVTQKTSGEAWGLLSIVLDYQAVLRASGIIHQSNLSLVMRGKDGLGDEGEVFFGDASIIENQPVNSVVRLPHGHWTLYATPVNGWLGYQPNLLIWLLATGGYLAWLFMLYHRYKSELMHLDSVAAVLQSEKKFRKIFHDHNAVMLLIDADDGGIVDVNASAIAFYGYPYEEITSKTIHQINTLNPDEVHKEMQDAVRAKRNYFVFPHRLADGEIRYVEVHSTPINWDGKPLLFSIIHDINDRVESEQKLKLDAKVFEHSQEGVLVTNDRNEIITINRAFTDITGYVAEDVVGKDPALLKSGRHAPDFYTHMYDEIQAKGYWKGEIWNRKKDGSVYPQLLSISKVENDAGILTHFVAVFSDITRLKRSEARMEQLAHYDALTQLPNRLLLKSRIELGIERAKRRKAEKVAILFLDLDHFKMVNDSLGHMLGDELLRQVSQRLLYCMRKEDTVARIGGDEFVVLLEGIGHTDDLAAIAQNIIEELKVPFVLEDTHEVVIGVSVGIAVYPEDADDINKLLTFADTAMYKAKHNGRNTFAFYTEAITKQADHKLKTSNELRKAIGNDELELYYQPQIDLATNRIIGAEALIRWNHPKDGLLGPYAFIEIAEETGLIHEISKWVIARGCQQLKHWQDKGLDLHLALNISPRDFRYDDFVTEVSKNIETSGIQPETLELELTENGLMEANADVLELLQQLKTLKLSLAVDDFGTGHSSIAYLKHFPVDKLKIDRSFVKDLETDSSDVMITETIIDMARNFGLKVVAEGVETQGQASLLKELECDIVQGYLYSKPVPVDEFEEKIAMLANNL